MICPFCGQEGQAITCIAGSRENKIVYHSKKILQNICNIAPHGDAESAEGEHEQTLLPGFVRERPAED